MFSPCNQSINSSWLLFQTQELQTLSIRSVLAELTEVNHPQVTSIGNELNVHCYRPCSTSTALLKQNGTQITIINEMLAAAVRESELNDPVLYIFSWELEKNT